jgi:polar amino acid transport system substrate-binding protein
MKSEEPRQHGGVTKRIVSQMLAALALLAGFVTAIHAANNPKPACPDVLEVGYPPDGLTAGGKRGINREVIDALAKRSGCRFRSVEMPAARATAELERGTLHIAGGRWFQTAEREKYAWFAHFQASKILAITRADDRRLHQATDLTNNGQVIIGIVPGFKHSPTIDPLLERVSLKDPKRLMYFKDREVLFQALQLGRVDVIFVQREVYARFAARPGTLPTQASDIMPREKPQQGGLMLSRTYFSAAEAEKWRTMVSSMCLDCMILSIFRHYFDATPDDLACHQQLESRDAR